MRRRTARIGVVSAMVLLSCVAGAQDIDRAIVAADSARREIDAATAVADGARLERVITYLEQSLAQHPRDAWLEYYLGFAHFRASNVADGENDRRASRAHLDRADAALKRSLAIRESAETHALMAAVLGQMIDGMISGIRLGRRAEGELNRALELEPTNPRVWVIRASAAFHKPRLFGGSAERAEEYARRAIGLLDSVASVPAPAPSWGESDAYTFLGLALDAQKKHAEARAAYDHVLRIEPGNRYVARLRAAREQTD